MGHAGSDVEIAYRSPAAIQADHARDPLLGTARALVERACHWSADAVLDALRAGSGSGSDAPGRGAARSRSSRAATEVMAPLRSYRRVRHRRGRASSRPTPGRLDPRAGDQRDPRRRAARPTTTSLVFGEDVAVKGGVYGVTRGLRNRFGADPRLRHPARRADRPGHRAGQPAWPASCPCPRSSTSPTCTTPRTSCAARPPRCGSSPTGQYAQRDGRPRSPGLAYQKGFGGHFHNDNSLAVLRDIPGLVRGRRQPPARGARAPARLPRPGRERGPGLRVSSSRSRATTPATCSTATAGWLAPYDARDPGRARRRGRLRHRAGPPPRHVRQRRLH